MVDQQLVVVSSTTLLLMVDQQLVVDHPTTMVVVGQPSVDQLSIGRRPSIIMDHP